MDRYVIRERRTTSGADYPEGNQMIAFSATSTGNNITMPETIYFGTTYGSPIEGANMHRFASPSSHGPVPVMQNLNQNVYQSHDRFISGIDPRYLAMCADNNAAYIAGHQIQREPTPSIAMNAFGSGYQQRNFIGAERNENKQYVTQRIPSAPKPESFSAGKNVTMSTESQSKAQKMTNEVPFKKQTEMTLVKNELQNQVKTRSEKIKEIQKAGTRVFSGPVEKILKWHKSIQDIGVMIFYEIVGKCVSVRPGERCSKNLVVRDENGPAIQVVYYEVDFLLPELKPPCPVRVIGRITQGTNRLQAFSVRPASGDDVAMLPRRAAVAAHHVAKLCKDLATNTV